MTVAQGVQDHPPRSYTSNLCPECCHPAVTCWCSPRFIAPSTTINLSIQPPPLKRKRPKRKSSSTVSHFPTPLHRAAELKPQAHATWTRLVSSTRRNERKLHVQLPIKLTSISRVFVNARIIPSCLIPLRPSSTAPQLRRLRRPCLVSRSTGNRSTILRGSHLSLIPESKGSMAIQNGMIGEKSRNRRRCKLSWWDRAMRWM